MTQNTTFDSSFWKPSSWLLSFSLTLLATPVMASPSGWDEGRATEAFLSESPQVAAIRKQRDAAQAEMLSARIWQNPVLTLEREQLFPGSGTTSQNRLSFEIPLYVSGRQGLRQAMAEANLARVDAGIEAQVWRQVQDFWEAYVHGHFAEARMGVASEGLLAYQRLEKIVRTRAAAGESAGYDALRMKLAAEDLKARHGDLRIRARESRAKLETLLGRSLEGSLDLAPSRAGLESPEALLTRALQRPEVRAMQAEQQQARLAVQLAGRSMWQDPLLGLGLLQSSDPTSFGLGYVAGLTWPLPLFDRGQGELARAEALKERAKAEEMALRNRLTLEVPAARSILEQRTETRGAFRQEALERLPSLLKMAETAYQEGEAPILSLLDAYQAAFEIRMHDLDLLESVQIAKLQLDRLTGAPLTQRMP